MSRRLALYTDLRIRILTRPAKPGSSKLLEIRRAGNDPADFLSRINASTGEKAGKEKREHFQMYAVIKTGGKQYRVAQGDRLHVEKLAGNVGDTVTFGEVLAVGAGEGLKIGQPLVAGASVEAKITAQDKDKKIVIFKFRRRKNYRRKTGHRQPFTALEVVSIKGA